MAGAASKGLIVIIGRMCIQTKASAGGVFKWLAIHQGWLPAIGCVTFSAIGAEKTLVSIWFFMAGGAFLRCAFKLASGVAAFARGFLVNTG